MSFKVVQKQNTRNPRDFFKFYERVTWGVQKVLNSFKNKTQKNFRCSFKFLEKKALEAPRGVRTLSKTKHNGLPTLLHDLKKKITVDLRGIFHTPSNKKIL